MRNVIRSVALVLVMFAFAQSLRTEVTDLVVRNAVIWTVDADHPRAETLASRNGHIVYVSSDGGSQEYVGADTRVVNLDGAFVTPT
jgi:predicted amidohydrolase YtcJ